MNDRSIPSPSGWPPGDRPVTSEDEPWPGTVSPHVEDAISLAFLIDRDGSPELRQEQAAWMKNTFALSFSDT